MTCTGGSPRFWHGDWGLHILSPRSGTAERCPSHSRGWRAAKFFLLRPGTPGIGVKVGRAPDGAQRIILPGASQLSYIERQEERHRERTFQEEYLEFLQESGINYDGRYLW